MDRISELPDELVTKILSFAPMKVAVSTSVLSKRWEYLWMWVPKLEYIHYKNLSRDNNRSVAPTIESLSLGFDHALFQPEDIKLWVETAISRCVRELSIYCGPDYGGFEIALPSSLYTCKSLLALKLDGHSVLVDVPPTVCLPSLRTLQLEQVRCLNQDSLGSLLSCCPVLEDLAISRQVGDNLKTLAVIHPSLQRLTLLVDAFCPRDDGIGSVIDTPSLKYFKVEDPRPSFSYSIKHMPQLEEADIFVSKGLGEFVESITSVKRLSLQVFSDNEQESMYRSGIVFDQLEHLKLQCHRHNWSKLLVRLLDDSPKL
ncbi:unnamed protein product [Thlaspi arvense]|uniref:F-box domain-containing protein n=1 Tax=Thlaspi arvense TaxID=13288 RepID=A0AAU9S9P7_THLAR|nr:unnamed protein product [Thlaspi arvense]